MKITKDTLIGEILEYDRAIAVILMQAGMHCVGCPASAAESLEEACAVHGIDTDQVLQDINDYLDYISLNSGEDAGGQAEEKND